MDRTLAVLLEKARQPAELSRSVASRTNRTLRNTKLHKVPSATQTSCFEDCSRLNQPGKKTQNALSSFSLQMSCCGDPFKDSIDFWHHVVIDVSFDHERDFAHNALINYTFCLFITVPFSTNFFELRKPLNCESLTLNDATRVSRSQKEATRDTLPTMVLTK